MRDLFGNPVDGTFLAWLADRGLWAGLTILGSVIFWWVTHKITEAWIQRAAVRLEDHWLLGEFVKGKFFQRWIDEIAIALLILPLVVGGTMDILGVDMGPLFTGIRDAWSDNIWPWMRTHGLKIVVILVVGWLAANVLGKAMPKLLTRAILGAERQEESPEEAKRRADTLSSVFSGIVSVAIFIVVMLTVLQEFNVPIGPLIGSLGLVGVAVGFGAQWLVRDVIAGAFIIGENQYRKGDVVEVSGVAGLVESINLRRTLLRDIDGKLHVVSNGEIKVASNFSRKWSRTNLDIEVAYKHNMDHVLNLLTEIGEKMAKEPYWREVLLETPKPTGMEKFNASGISIKILAMTKPLKHVEVKRELMYRIKKRFDEEGIEIPFPHQTIYWGDGAHPQHGREGSAEDRIALREKLQLETEAARVRRAQTKDIARAEAVVAAEKHLSRAFDKLAEARAAGKMPAGQPTAAVSDAEKDVVKPALTEQDHKDARKTRSLTEDEDADG